MRVTTQSPVSMIELLRDRAAAQGDDTAFTFLEAGEREQRLIDVGPDRCPQPGDRGGSRLAQSSRVREC